MHEASGWAAVVVEVQAQASALARWGLQRPGVVAREGAGAGTQWAEEATVAESCLDSLVCKEAGEVCLERRVAGCGAAAVVALGGLEEGSVGVEGAAGVALG